MTLTEQIAASRTFRTRINAIADELRDARGKAEIHCLKVALRTAELALTELGQVRPSR